MTQQEALQEAQRRWGDTAWVMVQCGVFMVSSGVRRKGDTFYRVYGEGDSWEAAFALADRREREK